MTVHITDEILMAYADEQLNAETTDQVAAYIRDHPEARELVEDYRRTAALAAAAYSAPINEPPPQRLVETIRSHAAKQNERKILKFPVWKRFEHYGMAAAAAIALTVGLAVGANFLNTAAPPAGTQHVRLGPLPVQTAVAKSLEQRPSGQVFRIRDGQFMTIIGTFADRGQRYCREFEILRGQSRDDALPEAAAIACRHPDATWVVEGAAHVEMADAQGGNFVPSGVTEKDALDGLVKMLGLGETLAPKTEAGLLENGWKSQG
ncbi:MAG: hypothetical protein AAGD43_26630 [Pseudomonadota bacterium]